MGSALSHLGLPGQIRRSTNTMQGACPMLASRGERLVVAMVEGEGHRPNLQAANDRKSPPPVGATFLELCHPGPGPQRHQRRPGGSREPHLRRQPDRRGAADPHDHHSVERGDFHGVRCMHVPRPSTVGSRIPRRPLSVHVGAGALRRLSFERGCSSTYIVTEPATADAVLHSTESITRSGVADKRKKKIRE